MGAPVSQTHMQVADVVPFLGVECSARNNRWVDRLDKAAVKFGEAISQQQQVPQLLGRVLAARGVTPETAEDFLNPTLKRLMPDPSLLRDMDTGASRLATAIRNNEAVAIYGDYDVDGAASCALVGRFLRAHGLEPTIYIPDRMLEGYGPNIPAFESLIQQGAGLIVTVDCGTASHEEIKRARDLGADVVVIDHHLSGDELPEAVALINPNRQDDVSEAGNLAACGVAFLFLVAIARELRNAGWYSDSRPECDLLQWLNLVALATVCDVVPLTGLNRAMVTKGLQVMRQRSLPGLRALSDIAGLAAEPTAYHLGYVLGPRINAGGRVGNSLLGARLLLSDDDLESAEIAQRLEQHNSDRKNLESRICEEAMSQVSRELEVNPDRRVLIAHGDEWHRGVVGLVAARLVETFGRPAIAIAWEQGGRGAGSARSVAGIDIGSAVTAAKEQGILASGGGHAMAAGLSVDRASLPMFDEFLQSYLAVSEAPLSDQRLFRIDGALISSAATSELVSLLEQAGPFGQGNPAPRFVLPTHRCTYAKIVGGSHVRCSLSGGDGARIDGIAFRAAGTPLGDLLLGSDGMPLHVAGQLRRNSWGGREKVELQIEDAAMPRKS